jgi:hypothetical protein
LTTKHITLYSFSAAILKEFLIYDTNSESYERISEIHEHRILILYTVVWKIFLHRRSYKWVQLRGCLKEKVATPV